MFFEALACRAGTGNIVNGDDIELKACINLVGILYETVLTHAITAGFQPVELLH